MGFSSRTAAYSRHCSPQSFHDDALEELSWAPLGSSLVEGADHCSLTVAQLVCTEATALQQQQPLVLARPRLAPLTLPRREPMERHLNLMELHLFRSAGGRFTLRRSANSAPALRNKCISIRFKCLSIDSRLFSPKISSRKKKRLMMSM